MFKNKKVIFISISVVLLMALTAGIVSFSLKKSSVGVKDKEDVAGGSTVADNYMTIVDRIIELANSSDPAVIADQKDVYKVVEIVPDGTSTTGTALQNFVDEYGAAGFAKMVLDNNATQGGTMPSGKISINTYNVSDLQAIVEAANSAEGSSGDNVGVLNDADLIYLSCDPTNTYSGNNDIPEVVYNFLRTYSVGKDKPIMVDYTTGIAAGGGTAVTLNVNTLVTDVFEDIKLKTATTPWTGTWTADSFKTFLKGSPTSMYSTYNSGPSADLRNKPFKVLVISPSGQIDGYDQVITPEIIDAGAFRDKNYTPGVENIEVVCVSASALDVAGLSYGLSDGSSKNYDMVFVAPGDYSHSDITPAVATELETMARDMKYVIYSSSLKISSNSGSSGATSSNFKKYLEYVFTKDGTGKYANVLKTEYGYFNAMTQEKADDIARIINNGVYRTYGGSGAKAGRKYTVLELQPCYPIDTDLAATLNGNNEKQKIAGNYYTVPQDVLSGVTKDEIPAGTEYYDFDVSKAKIAHATGIPYSQIELVQMSTEEFIGSKDVSAEKYDLIYIGGNTTALKQPAYNLFTTNVTDPQTLIQAITAGYGMYTHTGMLVTIKSGDPGGTGGTKYAYGNLYQTGGSYSYGVVPTGNPVDTTATLNGNDLTKLKLDDLKEYIDAGYPIVFSSEVWNAYDKIKDQSKLQQYTNRLIDPDSYMYQLLSYADDKKNGDNPVSNIATGLNPKNVARVNSKVGNDKSYYGVSLVNDNTVEVFDVKSEAMLTVIIDASRIRPTFELTSCPKEYVEGDTTSYISGATDMSVAYNIKGDGNYTVELLVDEDGNGLFDDSVGGEELKDSKTVTVSGEANGTVAYEFDDPEFYGLRSWEVLVKQDGYAVAYYTGFARYARGEDVEKKEIKVLQIMSLQESQPKWTNGHSLYLCTECMHTGAIADCNMFYDGFTGSGTDSDYLNAYGTMAEYNGKHANGPVNIGLHEHKFGIVKYDTVSGVDDWNSNFADILSEDYNFDIDIMTLSEYEALVKEIKDKDQDTRDNYLAAAQTALNDYEAAVSDLENSGVEEDLVNYMETLIASGGQGLNVDGWDEIIEKQEYYEIFYNNGNLYYNAGSTDIVAKYNAYIEKKDAVVEANNRYKENMRKAYDSDNWLAQNYSMVVLGFSENFGNNDMSDDGCADLIAYDKKHGNILTTHDTTTKWADFGAVNLTSKLADTFGMDRFHATTEASEDVTGIKPQYVSIDPVNVATIPDRDKVAANQVVVKDKDIEAKIVKNAAGKYEVVSYEEVGAPKLVGSQLSVKYTAYTDKTCTTVDTSLNGTVNYAMPAKEYWQTSFTTQFNNGVGTVTDDNMKVATYSESAADYVWGNYTTTDFWTNIAVGGDPYAWSDTFVANAGTVGKRTPIALTDSKMIFSTSELGNSPYKYAEYRFTDAEKWASGFENTASGTSKATQTNDGIITTYPFYISKQLEISNTHAQSLALDMEDEETIVWYTLAGCDVGPSSSNPKDVGKDKGNSSLLAASPKDAMDSYFIYTKGNITYCGAGHSHITGGGKNNNDERRLFINVIVNSVRDSIAKPKITLYDKGSNVPAPAKDGLIQLDDDNNYYLEIDKKTDFPEFGFKVKVDKSAEPIASVRIYYDLNYGKDGNYSDKFTDDEYHRMIKTYAEGDITNKQIYQLATSDYPEGLAPENMFDYYGGNYTYIVIEATDGLGQVRYLRLKIVNVKQLFDLTMNESEDTYLDAIVKYNM